MTNQDLEAERQKTIANYKLHCTWVVGWVYKGNQFSKCPCEWCK